MGVRFLTIRSGGGGGGEFGVRELTKRNQERYGDAQEYITFCFIVFT